MPADKKKDDKKAGKDAKPAKDDKKAGKDAKPAKDDKKAGKDDKKAGKDDKKDAKKDDKKDAKPAAAVAAVTAAVSKVTVSSALPVGWTEHVDPATKKTFYHNASTYIWWMLDVHMQVTFPSLHDVISCICLIRRGQDPVG